MINQNDQSNTRDGDSELAQKISTGRRRFLQAAGIGATGLTGFGGLAAGQSDDNVIELEAVNVQAGGGRGRGEYVWEDGEVQGPPDNVCSYEQGNHVWVGVSPSDIDGQTNPTLDLTAGESYTVEWTNTTGDAHNFVIVDADGNEILATEEISQEGTTQVVEFEATEAMAEYYCAPHSGSQRGEVTVGDGGDPMPSPDEVNLMIVSVTKGYSHRNIPYGVDKLKGLSDRIAAETGANSVNIDTVPEEIPDDVTETKPDDSSAFPTDASELEKYDAIIWFSTTGDVLDDPAQRDAFEEYMRNGGGYAGIHAAGDTHHPGDGEWDFYLGMHGGAYFTGHPENQDAEIHVTDQVHPSTTTCPPAGRSTTSGTITRKAHAAKCTSSRRSTRPATTARRWRTAVKIIPSPGHKCTKAVVSGTLVVATLTNHSMRTRLSITSSVVSSGPAASRTVMPLEPSGTATPSPRLRPTSMRG